MELTNKQTRSKKFQSKHNTKKTIDYAIPYMLQSIQKTYLVNESIHQLSLKNVSERNPRQVAQQRLQRRANQSLLVAVGQHKLAQLEDEVEFVVERVLEGLDLFLNHLAFREVEDLLTTV